MQTAGILKKRRKRNLAKVNGLSQTPYEEKNDYFTGTNLYSNQDDERPKSFNSLFSKRTDTDTRLQFNNSGMLDYRREGSGSQNNRNNSGRVTRNPNFHADLSSKLDLLWGNRPNTGYSGKSDQTVNKLGGSLSEREYFLDKHTMQRLRQIIWLGIATGSFPWKWNNKTYTLERWSPFLEKLWWIVWFFVTIQTLLLTAFQVNLFYSSVKVAKTYRTAFQSSFSTLWYSYNLMFKIFLFYYKEPIREYINTLMKFNQNYVQKYVIHLDDHQDGGRWVINGAILTNFAQIGISITFFFLMAEFPWYIFSYIAPKPWYWLLPGAFHEFMLVGQVITAYVLICWMIVAHSNTLNFWLRETHYQYDSDFTTDALRSPRVAIETYRNIQVLSKLFNNCISSMGIPFLKIAMSTGTIPTGYVLVRSMNHLFIDEFPGILTYPVSIVDCCIAAFVVMNITAEVYDMGTSFVVSWGLTKHKDFRRILMSCSSLKLYVGRYYFITMSTTITFLKSIFDIIIDCIITFP